MGDDNNDDDNGDADDNGDGDGAAPSHNVRRKATTSMATAQRATTTTMMATARWATTTTTIQSSKKITTMAKPNAGSSDMAMVLNSCPPPEISSRWVV